jgi:hypothetical protein
MRLGPNNGGAEVAARAAVVSTRRSRLGSSAARLAQPSLDHVDRSFLAIDCSFA